MLTNSALGQGEGGRFLNINLLDFIKKFIYYLHIKFKVQFVINHLSEKKRIWNERCVHSPIET